MVVAALTVDGEGLDPSYLTTLIPLVIVPIVSMLTTDTGGDPDTFYSMLSGERPVDRALV